jgi:hypothetical protein
MTTYVAPTVSRIQSSGEYGNAFFAHGTYTAAAAAINDNVYLVRLYAGTKIYNVRLINAALGASTTVDIGFKHVDGQAGDSPTAFLTAQATSTAGANQSSTAPITLAFDAYIVATFKGGVATGQIDAIVQYEFVGT